MLESSARGIPVLPSAPRSRSAPALRTVLTLFLAVSFAGLSVSPPVEARKSERGKGHVLPSDEQYDIGIAKYKEKDYDGAIDAFKQSIYFARNEYMPQAYYWLGVCYKLKHEDLKAIEAFKKHLTQSIGYSPDANCHLGEIFLRNNRLDEAEEQAKAAVYGDRAKGYNLWGLVLQAKGDGEGASSHFMNALGSAPWTFYEAWMNYVGLLMKKRLWANSIKQLSHMLVNEKPLKGINYEDIHLKRGLCFLAVGDHQHALEDWHKCLSYNPNNIEAHLQLAMMFDMEKHISSAIKEYKEFARLSGDPKRVEPVKQRILFLEQAIAPKQAEPAAPPPSAQMRKQKELEEMARQEQERASQGGDRLAPHDSGF